MNIAESMELIDKPTFFGSLFLLLAVTIPLIVFPEQGAVWVLSARGFVTGNLGVSFNGNGQIFGLGLSGETAFSVNLGVIAPLSYRLTVVGEVGYAGERFTGFDDETTVLTGVNVMLKDGSFRAAVAFGLSDGAPDVEVTVGYAFPF